MKHTGEYKRFEIPRPIDFMQNPFIGRDGRDYQSYESLRQANEEHNARIFVKVKKE
ncbi:MAG: hypothetical protein AABW88_04295 [Nanoarchaeota archaeon]